MHMRFYAPLLALLYIPALLAFEGGLDITVGNDADASIQMQLLLAKHPTVIKKGEWGTVGFPNPTPPENGLIQIQTDGCVLEYDVMPTVDYPWRTRGVVRFQLERDLYLYAVPPNSKAILPLSEITGMQTKGFPLRPVKKECS